LINIKPRLNGFKKFKKFKRIKRIKLFKKINDCKEIEQGIFDFRPRETVSKCALEGIAKPPKKPKS
jgi:hypothetical protein